MKQTLCVKVRSRYSVAHGSARWKVIYDAPMPDGGTVEKVLEAYQKVGNYPTDRFDYQYTVTMEGGR